MIGRPIIFGEVLFDHFPDGSTVLGGAPFNVAWHLQALGLHPLFISRVGDDAMGREIRDAMMGWGMETAGLQQESAHPTGTVEVSLEDGQPSYDIVADRAYDHISPGVFPPDTGDGGMVYHGTLATRHADSRAALDVLLERAAAPVFLDVNLRDPWWDRDAVLAQVARADHVKLNDAELDLLVPGTGDPGERARGLLEAHDLTTLVVTRGSAGALGLDHRGSRAEAAPEKAVEVVDTVGAGDAFAAVLITGLLEGWTLNETLERAQGLASAVVGRRGATIRDRDFYRPFAERWELRGG